MSTANETALGGILPVIMTPFHEDWSIDETALAAEIDWLFENGADGLTVAMVSEINRLTFDERADLGATVVRLAAGRGPVILSVGAESTHTAAQYAKRAFDDGASGLMAAPPLLVKGVPSVDSLRDYLNAILDVAPIPLVLQDASSYVGAAIPSDVQGSLVTEFGPERLYLKPEAEPLGPIMSDILASEPQARIFDGSGGVALMDTYLRGVVGTMPGPDLVWAVRALWDALAADNRPRALELMRGLTTLISMVPGLDGYVAFGKHLLTHQGIIPHARMRGPVAFSIDPVTRELIESLFAHLQYIVKNPSENGNG